MAKRNTRRQESNAVDTLRLSERAQTEILTRMQRQEAASSRLDNRNAQRVEYVLSQGITVTIQHPGGSTICYLVRPRNLSRGGMNFLHGQFLYQGTHCTLSLRTTENEPMLVEGVVTRCNHVQGTVHEIGVQFESAISLADYVVDSPEEVSSTSDVAPLPTLVGKVLHIQKHAVDRDLVRFFLGLMGVEATSVENAEEVEALMEKTLFNAIFVGDEHEELIAEIRKREYPGPIILMTDRESDEDHQAAKSQGATGVLVKPFTASALAEVLEEHLRHDPSQAGIEALVSANWPDVKMRPLILGFLGRLEEQIDKLDRLGNDREVASLRDLCRDIKGNAGSYGYPQISDKARELTQLALDDSPAEQWHKPLTELKELCERACIVRRKKDTGKS